MKILVIGGGISGERDVSLRSSKSVFDAISENHQKEFYDWDGSTDWLEQNLKNFDVVLPILHGEGGEDGQIQKILEVQGAKYLGSDSAVSQICIDKDKTQEALQRNTVLVPKYRVLSYQQYVESPIAQGRHVVKPVNGGSSLHTFIDVRSNDSSATQIKQAFDMHGNMMVEEFIAGTEVTVPVLEGKTLPLIEIIPPEGGFFDYNNKYNGLTQELCPSPNVSRDLQKKAQEISTAVHKSLGCKHLSRVDMIIDSKGQIYTLEINTMPGMTDQSLFPKSANQIGMSMQDLVEYLIDLVGQS